MITIVSHFASEINKLKTRFLRNDLLTTEQEFEHSKFSSLQTFKALSCEFYLLSATS